MKIEEKWTWPSSRAWLRDERERAEAIVEQLHPDHWPAWILDIAASVLFAIDRPSGWQARGAARMGHELENASCVRLRRLILEALAEYDGPVSVRAAELLAVEPEREPDVEILAMPKRRKKKAAKKDPNSDWGPMFEGVQA